MTIALYARKNKWPLGGVTVRLRHSRVHAKDCDECVTKDTMLDRIESTVTLAGELTAEQHAKLVEIGGRCPVHRTLKSEINIRTTAG